MSKRGKVLNSTERTILLKVMIFFEEEKQKKLAIKPYDLESILLMKYIARSKSLSKSESAGLNEIECKLLENEAKYQALLKSFDNIVKRTAAATGISERTLKRIKLEAKKKGTASPEPGTSSMSVPCSEIKLSTPRQKLQGKEGS